MGSFMRGTIWFLGLAGVAGLLAVGYATRTHWMPGRLTERFLASGDAADNGHSHGEESTGGSIVLSDQARRNLGLKVGAVAIGEYWRSIRVPATVVERPGHSHRKLTAPLTCVIQELYVHPNQVLRPGDRVADLEVKGDALATKQAEVLQLSREIELNGKELGRVTKLVETGTVPEQDKLKLEYEQSRLQAQLESKSQELEVLGLTQAQVEEVIRSRQLLRSFTLAAPAISSEEQGHLAEAASLASVDGKGGERSPTASDQDLVYTVESIDVFPGKRVQAGEEIGSLAFHVILYVAGQAFEREGEIIAKAMVERWPVTARFETLFGEPLTRRNLRILFMDNVIDESTRTFKFYLGLRNEVLHDNVGPGGESYRSWRFKPGQKVELEVPIERIENVLVLPVDAVVKEGPHSYVFRANGKRLERLPVTVVHSGRESVALANDGSVFPGEVVALNNAYQIGLAVRKAEGGQEGGHEGHDHHGHSHEH